MGCIGSCIGSCLATCGCEAMKCCGQCGPKRGSRIPYLVCFFISTALALILRYWGGPMLIHLYWYDYQLCNTDKCVGFGAAYRISFTLCIFFLFHALALYSNSCQKIDQGFWMPKIFCLIFLLIIAYIIPNEFFDGYTHVARVVGGIFLLLQIIILIDFAYAWSEDWNSDEKNWKAAILIVSFLFFAASVVLLVFMFIWFAGSGCGLEKFFLAFTIILTFTYTIISITFANPGGILPPAIMSLYAHYVCFNALSSDPNVSCNPFETTDTTQLVIGLLIAAASTTYAAYNLATSNSIFGDNEEAAAADVESGKAVVPKEAPKAEVMDAKASEKDKSNDNKSGDDNKNADKEDDEPEPLGPVQAMRNAKFHFIMAAGSMYMAMILTNWSSRQEVQDNKKSYDVGEENMWIKISSQWLTCLLYIWSLIAPFIMKNRDFS